MDSIKKVTNVELKENKEKLLNSMRILMHTAKGIFESTPFRDKDIAVGTGCHNLVIEAGGDTYPVFYTPDTMFADGTVAITDDIYDEENYLLLSDDDDMLWLSLVMQLDTLYKDECERSNGLDEALKEANKKCSEYVKEIDKLTVDNKRLSERVKTLVIEKTNRPDTAEKVSDPKEDIETKDLDMVGLHLITKIIELENENESLKKKLFSGVPTKFGEQERGTPEDKAVKMDIETALMQQQIANLNTRIAQLEEKLKSTETELTTAMNANGILKTKIAVLTDEKREAELLAYRLTRGEMRVQFDNMKSLEHENGVLKNENADLNQKLYQKEDEDDLKKKIAEYAQKYDEALSNNKKLRQEFNKLRVQLNSYSGASVVNHDDMQQTITKETFAELTARINELEEENDSIKKKNDELLDYNTKLRQEITKLRVDAGLSVADSVNGMQQISSILEPHIVSADDDMKYIITYKALNEVTTRIKELEAKIKDKDERINQMSKINAGLSVENKNIAALLREATGNARFYAREVDKLEKEKQEAERKAFILKEGYIGEKEQD